MTLGCIYLLTLIVGALPDWGAMNGTWPLMINAFGQFTDSPRHPLDAWRALDGLPAAAGSALIARS